MTARSTFDSMDAGAQAQAGRGSALARLIGLMGLTFVCGLATPAAAQTAQTQQAGQTAQTAQTVPHPGRAVHAADTLRAVNQAIERQLAWAAHGVATTVLVEPFALVDDVAGSTASDPAGLRWGPLRQPDDRGSRLASQALGGSGLYAHVDLASVLPALPARWQQAVGRPDGGVTIELRPISSPLSGLAMGSMLRWQLREGGQMALRLRGRRLSLQYGLNFSL